MKQFVLLIFGCFFVLFGQAQVKFSGRVVDEKQQALYGVQIGLLSSGQSVSTNENGEFEIDGVNTDQQIFFLFLVGYQQTTDTIEVSTNKTKHTFILPRLKTELDEVTISETRTNGNLSRGVMKSVEGTAIYAGKKTELIEIDQINANLATNNARQVYAKIGGLNIWESDGSGLQLDIGGRGLSPSRTANFNTRQNGYDISADALGYPESYYTPPTAAVSQIEVVRGAASLQYGTQFGGMLNFKLRENKSTKPLAVVARQTIGSFGLINSFVSAEGKKKKVSYYSFFQYKEGNGYRDNSNFSARNGYLSVVYKPTRKWELKADYTLLNYLAHQPGGLTDKQFLSDPTQSKRERNWFSVNWNLASLNATYSVNSKTKINTRFFGLLANRKALGNLKRIDRPDITSQARNLIIGEFTNIGNETRLLHHYHIKKTTASFLIGARVYKGITDSKQGFADNGFGPNFTFDSFETNYQSDYSFPNVNIAAFAENIFRISPLWSITPGLRFEYINTASRGNYRIANYHPNTVQLLSEQKVLEDFERPRSFVLAGIGTSYKIHEYAELYGNVSQNYKSITFSDIRIVNPSFEVDSNIQDESGYTVDIGIRGRNSSKYRYEFTGFYLKYNNRIGNNLITSNGLPKRQRTNIADSRTFGVEALFEMDLLACLNKETKNGLVYFINLAYNNARYFNSKEKAFENKLVELVPEWLIKTGLTYKREKWSVTAQHSYTAAQYTDATNAISTDDAVHGIVPAYFIQDISGKYKFSKHFELETGVNNLMNNAYFTRRAAGYPGPGIIPSDGRSYYLTLIGKF
jgi:Fe(3+) dicitrate transport protein